MLTEMIMDLLSASSKAEKERAYRRLERVGVDRMTARVMASEYYKEMKKDGRQ